MSVGANPAKYSGESDEENLAEVMASIASVAGIDHGGEYIKAGGIVCLVGISRHP